MHISERIQKVTIKGVLCALLMLSSNLTIGQSTNDYLKTVLGNLNQIKSASYIRYMSATAPYDTVVSKHYNVYIKEFINPADNYVGASIAQYMLEDSTKLVYFYDGVVKSYLNWENKTVPVDSFQLIKTPFRVVYPPFFTYVKSLLKYALETKDNIQVEVKDFGDSIQASLYVKDKNVEVVGNRIIYANLQDFTKEKYAFYDIWIHKATGLPYRVKKKLPKGTTWESVTNIRVNKTNSELFVASNYYPPDFTITYKDKAIPNPVGLVGQPAPDWILKDADHKSVALTDLKSKVILIQFTGIGCGPCYTAIPFLKQIVKDYKGKSFEFVSIETWSKNADELKKYQQKNGFNFTFLKSEDNVTKDYKVSSVPVFFILDDKRVIRKVINGYKKGTTDKEIRESIKKLIN